jgi:hypothetical protein
MFNTVEPSTKVRARVQGKPQQPNFNGQGVIDLNTFTDVNIPDPKDDSLMFSHWTFLNISKPQYSLNDLNEGIRDDDIDSWGDHVEDLKQSLVSVGFSMSQTTPWVYEDGGTGDGRSRFKSARELGYEYFPVAVFVKTGGEVTPLDRLVNAAKSNMQGFPQKRPKKNDFIANAVKALREQWIENDLESVKEFCFETLGLSEYYANSTATVTEIATKAYNKFNADGNSVLPLHASQIKDWLNDNGYKLDKRTKLVTTNNETYALREFESILDSVNKGYDPISFIFYTKAPNGDKARKDLDNFLKKLESLYTLSQKAVLKNIEKSTGMKMTLPHTDERPWQVLGCIPQILGEHPNLEDTNQLISVKDY